MGEPKRCSGRTRRWPRRSESALVHCRQKAARQGPERGRAAPAGCGPGGDPSDRWPVERTRPRPLAGSSGWPEPKANRPVRRPPPSIGPRGHEHPPSAPRLRRHRRAGSYQCRHRRSAGSGGPPRSRPIPGPRRGHPSRVLGRSGRGREAQRARPPGFAPSSRGHRRILRGPFVAKRPRLEDRVRGVRPRRG